MTTRRGIVLGVVAGASVGVTGGAGLFVTAVTGVDLLVGLAFIVAIQWASARICNWRWGDRWPTRREYFRRVALLLPVLLVGGLVFLLAPGGLAAKIAAYLAYGAVVLAVIVALRSWIEAERARHTQDV